jgi:hypothetical protein
MISVDDIAGLIDKLKSNDAIFCDKLQKLTQDNASVTILHDIDTHFVINGTARKWRVSRHCALTIRDQNNQRMLSAEGELLFAFYLAKWREKNKSNKAVVEMDDYIDSLDQVDKRRVANLQILYRYNLVSKANLEKLMSLPDEYQHRLFADMYELYQINHLNQATFHAACQHENKGSLSQAIYEMRESRDSKLFDKVTILSCIVIFLSCLATVILLTPIIGLFAMLVPLVSLVVLLPLSLYVGDRITSTSFYRSLPIDKSCINHMLESLHPSSFRKEWSNLHSKTRTAFNIEVLKISSLAGTYFLELFSRLNIHSTTNELFQLFKRNTAGRSISRVKMFFQDSEMFADVNEANFRFFLMHMDVFLTSRFSETNRMVPPHLMNDFMRILVRHLGQRDGLEAGELSFRIRADVMRMLNQQNPRRENLAPVFDAQNTHLPSVEQGISASARRLKDMIVLTPRTCKLILAEMKEKSWLEQFKIQDNHKRSLVEKSLKRLFDLNFTDEKSGVSIQEALVMAWVAIHDDKIRGDCAITDAHDHFINALFEIQTAYPNNQPACPRGSFNKIFEALKMVGVKDVDFTATTSGDVTSDFYRAITVELERVFKKKLSESIDAAKDMLAKLKENDLRHDEIWEAIKSGVLQEMDHHAFFISNSSVFKSLGIKPLNSYCDQNKQHYEFSEILADKFETMLCQATAQKNPTNHIVLSHSPTLFANAGTDHIRTFSRRTRRYSL